MKRISFSDWWMIPVYNDPAQASPGQVEIDLEKCTGCGFCTKVCPAGALVLEDKKPKMVPLGINECMSCGDCMPICPVEAVTVVRGNRFAGYYKTIDRGELEFPRLSF